MQLNYDFFFFFAVAHF